MQNHYVIFGDPLCLHRKKVSGVMLKRMQARRGVDSNCYSLIFEAVWRVVDGLHHQARGAFFFSLWAKERVPSCAE